MSSSMRAVQISVLASLMLVGSFGVAYAYGIQNHTSNSITHGCPFDDGCTGASNEAGDYVRHGYNRCADPYPACPNDGDMNFSRVRVKLISTDDIVAGNNCYNCGRVDVEYDTNPKKECKFLTSHYAENPDLNVHDHYTESALC